MACPPSLWACHATSTLRPERAGTEELRAAFEEHPSAPDPGRRAFLKLGLDLLGLGVATATFFVPPRVEGTAPPGWALVPATITEVLGVTRPHRSGPRGSVEIFEGFWRQPYGAFRGKRYTVILERPPEARDDARIRIRVSGDVGRVGIRRVGESDPSRWPEVLLARGDDRLKSAGAIELPVTVVGGPTLGDTDHILLGLMIEPDCRGVSPSAIGRTARVTIGLEWLLPIPTALPPAAPRAGLEARPSGYDDERQQLTAPEAWQKRIGPGIDNPVMAEWLADQLARFAPWLIRHSLAFTVEKADRFVEALLNALGRSPPGTVVNPPALSGAFQVALQTIAPQDKLSKTTWIVAALKQLSRQGAFAQSWFIPARRRAGVSSPPPALPDVLQHLSELQRQALVRALEPEIAKARTLLRQVASAPEASMRQLLRERGRAIAAQLEVWRISQGVELSDAALGAIAGALTKPLLDVALSLGSPAVRDAWRGGSLESVRETANRALAELAAAEAALQGPRAGLEEWEPRIAETYRGATVAVLGGTGFVGRQYVGELLGRYGESVGQVRALSRNPESVARSLGEHPKLVPYQGDHLNVERLRALIADAPIIIDTAGLAWQHLPGGKAASLEDELLQNGMSAALIGAVLQPGQRLVWTSSNASDYMFARLTEGDQEALQEEIDQRAQRYVAWVRTPEGAAPSEDALRAFIRGDLEQHPPRQFSSGPEGPEVVYAEQYSYPYSKLLGQQILELMGRGDDKDVRVLKISDVYGPGQGLGPESWDPTRPQRQAARRPQWFLATYEAIRAGSYEPWARMPAEGGFANAGGRIQHTVFDDVVAPTYVGDVVEVLFRASAAELPSGHVVLAVSAPWMPNVEMAQAIAKAVGVTALGQEITIAPGKPILRRQPQAAGADLGLLGMEDRLTPFDDGMTQHLAWWRAQDAMREVQPSRLREALAQDEIRVYIADDLFGDIGDYEISQLQQTLWYSALLKPAMSNVFVASESEYHGSVPDSVTLHIARQAVSERDDEITAIVTGLGVNDRLSTSAFQPLVLEAILRALGERSQRLEIPAERYRTTDEVLKAFFDRLAKFV